MTAAPPLQLKEVKTARCEQHHSPSLATKLTAFAVCNGLILAISATVLGLIVSLVLRPAQTTLYIIVPYFSFALATGDQLKSGRPWRYFSENFPAFSVLRSYLGFSFAPLPRELKEAESAKNAQFLIACFPHGAWSDYRVLMDGVLPEAFPNVGDKCRTLAASVLFRIPVVREISLWTGCVDARRSVAEKALDDGYSLLVIPGGEAEQLSTRYGVERVYLSKRKGFVKLAMRKRVPIVPVYVFGTNDLYGTSDLFYPARYWIMKNLRICIPLTWGLFGGLCPLPVKTTAVMGKPLFFDMKGNDPTEKELDDAHKVFCGALVDLFEEHKSGLNFGDRVLTVD